MNVDDFLERPEFEDVDEYLHTEMHDHSTHAMQQRMAKAFDGGKKARQWFFSQLPILDSKRPYDLCKDGRTIEVENLLWCMLKDYTK